MLRILTIFIIVYFLSSCTNKGVKDASLQEDLVTTRDAGYKPQLTQLEKDMQGCWKERGENNILWCFQKKELKWKGFTHVTAFDKNEIEVGNLIFQVSKKNDSLIVLTNKTSKQTHKLIREQF